MLDTWAYCKLTCIGNSSHRCLLAALCLLLGIADFSIARPCIVRCRDDVHHITACADDTEWNLLKSPRPHILALLDQHVRSHGLVLLELQNPTDSPLLEGRWRLLFTTRPGSASPIQKTFVGVESFTVYQEVLLTSAESARVNNIVDFGAKIGTLKVLQFLCIDNPLFTASMFFERCQVYCSSAVQS